ncbi:bifunctional diguanylate cyclase/phosphodiesterase [Natronosporangium hydrolyticum]|uniref:Bifunctional diguanylate cyclase/phosphodiesterase n=1 Tax=Natronosporangium hydrolyticum TaxID=2811111 RepID=A0A895YA40_9ACTN|nr:bifunctional diguanylate cyclase/phosphodiesterase [Natronosporangium hydrolyticum]QSB14634.1 bifunctional diguanylate cyclase/phosphodiesterase [Natronosporangium hydrolyticum]
MTWADETVGAGANGFVAAWSASLYGAVYAPLSPDERFGLLSGLTSRLSEAAGRQPFPAELVRRVGADLVAAGFNSSEVLGRTITLLTTRFAADLGVTDPHRATEVAAALADGFASAMRDRALDEQEEVRAAAMRAQHRAEQALRASEAKFHHFATHDTVTGLPNRTMFTEQLRERIISARPETRAVVCCVGLDRFAAVNDSLGFRVGDRLLVAVADRLRALAATAGWVIARFEGDQFALLAEASRGSDDATKTADRIQSAMAAPFHIEDAELPMTASIGVVEGPIATAVAAELTRAAQMALHWAKADGRGRWRLYSQARAYEDTERYRLSAEIPRGLRRGEFDLDYQPLVALDTGHLVGVEALARWHHPNRGRLAANQFIGLAEHTGLVVPLGSQLLIQACREASTWPAGTGRPPYVSVNASAVELQQSSFVGHVAQVLDRSGLAPERLQIEITEHAIIDARDAPGTLAALVGLGVRIAVDDFGTGYSNLARLRDLPLHTLKLDATFVQNPQVRDDAGADPEEFMAAVVSFGHTLGLRVIAEGIETTEHAERMRAAGCDAGQGWLFGRPGPAEEVLPDPP